MLATYCVNTECSELDLAKEIPLDMEVPAEIRCGACGELTTAPAESTAAAGESVR